MWGESSLFLSILTTYVKKRLKIMSFWWFDQTKPPYLLYVYMLMKNDIDYYYFISTFRSLAPPYLKQKGDLFYPHKKKKNPIN